MGKIVVVLSRAVVLAVLSLACAPDDALAATVIDHLSKVDASGQLVSGDVSVPLDGDLAVVLGSIDPATVIEPENVVLFLDGQAINGLKATRYKDKALIFHLVRNNDNAAA